jgi:UDP-N-acetylmuramoyl-L-alanyl-D-glutamate--2,6-diaminopimelate ligase
MNPTLSKNSTKSATRVSAGSTGKHAMPPIPRSAGALERLLSATTAGVRLVGADASLRISGLVDDSREAAPGTVFFARSGTKSDGLGFVRAARAAGSVLVVARELSASDVPTLLVPDVEAALREAADAWYGRPQDAIDLVGITGTKGKTTTSYLTRGALAASGRRCAVIGTIAYDVGDGRLREAPNTTPGALALRQLLAQARDAGSTACVMEISSHALDQARVEGLSMKVGVLTNLASDHLDYHKTPAAYFEAKSKLFSGLAPASTAVLNREDAAWARFAARSRCRVVTYGGGPECDFRATHVELAADGTTFRLAVGSEAEIEVATPLVGRHNIANLLAAVAAASALGVDPVTAVEGATSVRGVRGRLERVEPSGDLHVFVDYAHTEDALRQVLGFLRTVGALPITCVFGCGGDRDRTKRPRMGAVAAELSDRTIVTSDNPRTEDPVEILFEIESGIPSAARGHVTTVADRREAIRRAILEAPAGSTVLVAGKGHETYQILGTTKVPFDDVAEAKEALALRARGEAGLRLP